MDKKHFIDEYLNGKRPIEQEKWELPTESELDRDEALFDAILAEKKQASRFTKTIGQGLLAIAAVLIAAVALFAWWDFKPQGQPQLAETKEVPVEQKDTIKVIEKPHESKTQSSHEKSANFTQEVSKVHTRSLKTAQATSAEEKASTPTPLHGEGRKEASLLGGRLEGGSAADSLYYYLTQLEKQMGDCSDSTCLAELTNLMRADERIKDLMNKIIHKQVETAYQEEYLVDTTTRYIPL